MAKTIRTCDGDLLDRLCYAVYGHVKGTVEAVLARNHGLAAIKQPYPSGVMIHFPDLAAPVRETITLWE
jgi:phage tail protein X